MEVKNIESDIKSWLKIVLKQENLENFSLNILGNSEKGDGYLGDIVFVSLTSKNEDPSKKYDLVLKCSKRSQILREKTPVKEAFENEIYIYETVLPAFTKFQVDKGITDIFNSIPKCYGTLAEENMEVIVFQNLKEIGYRLWDKKRPLTRKHIDMVIKEYAKFHAISIAMKEQQPEIFEKLSNGLSPVFKQFIETSDAKTLFGTCIEQICEVLKGDLSEDELNTWKSLKEEINFVFTDMIENINGLKVILHGDCWSNNFLFKHDVHDIDLPLKVAILDWQISTCSSPILDLSYFIFAGISKEDLDDLDNVLRYYFENLKKFSRRLGCVLDASYSFEELLNDWKKYCKFGVVLSTLIFKVSATEKNEVIDLAQAAETGDALCNTFDYDVKDTAVFKNRSRHVVKYVVKNVLC